MKRHATPVAPNTLQPGYYIFWRHCTYRVIALDPANALLLRVEPIPAAPHTTLSLLDLLATPQKGSDPPLFAPTLELLHQQVEDRYALRSSATTADLPDNYLIKARVITTVVETVGQLLAEEERRAALRGESLGRTQALHRALGTVTATTIQVQVNGITYQRRLHASRAVYYKYRRLYDTYQGDEAAIATSFRRGTFRRPQMSQAQLHFIDTCLVLYYGTTRASKMRVYRLARDILEQRTGGYWVDPGRCGSAMAESLVTELLDLSIPLPAILDNPEKAAVLTPIEMPSTGWFYGYAKYVEAQPDQGAQLMTERLGQDLWEHFYLVFETFVHRAQFPLQYVFADHWLLDAWIVDEETRSKPSRLWLTLLIDAYSRSILGMALLYEDPCIESIQQALRHAIWEKTSHRELGLTQEWNCFGIPVQLLLDNAWAHHSHSLENLARVLSRHGVYNSIDLVFRPPYKGRYGAIIERLFKNFAGQVKELAAGAIASHDPKELRTAAHNACLLYPDMNRLLHQLILRYQHTPHRELGGMTPHQRWSEGIQSSGFPLVPPCTPAMDRLFLRLYPQPRQVSSKGIPAFGLHYWSASLAGIERIDRTGRAVEYQFRYDPADISRISLFRDGEWVGDGSARELQQADGTVRHLSLAEWKMARSEVGSHAGPVEGKTAGELALVSEVQALAKQRTAEKRAAQRTMGKRSSQASGELRQDTTPVPSEAPDAETERVLRFLHGRE
jgi:hypothetical protein